MQNHNTLNTTDFVSLDDGWDWSGWYGCSDRSAWTCGCGCTNNGCNTCKKCGCAREAACSRVRGNADVSCDKGTVRGNADRAACETGQTCRVKETCGASAACAVNPRTPNCAPCNEAIPVQQVMPCPANTRIRPAESCDVCHTASATANCASNPCQTASAARPCNTCNTCDACQPKNPCQTAPAARPCNTCNTCDACQSKNPCQNASCNAARNTSASTYHQGVGMVYAVKQRLGQVFDQESALRSGTLFPELHKPMNGYCPGSCNCANPEQKAAFSIWDLRLYLDTHPDDAQAQALFRRLTQEADEENYATAFLPDDDLSDGWDWTQDPWPWNCRPCGQ